MFALSGFQVKHLFVVRRGKEGKTKEKEISVWRLWRTSSEKGGESNKSTKDFKIIKGSRKTKMKHIHREI